MAACENLRELDMANGKEDDGVLVSEGSNMIGLEMSFHKKSLRKQMSLQVSYRVPGTHRITDKKHGGKIPSADPVGPSRSPMAWPSRPLRQVLF